MENILWDTFLAVNFQLLEEDGYVRQVPGEDTVILAHLHAGWVAFRGATKSETASAVFSRLEKSPVS